MNRVIVIILSLFMLSINCGESYAAESATLQPPGRDSSMGISRTRPGMPMTSLPSDRIVFSFKNNPYYFSRGFIYVFVDNQYKIVEAVEGMVIPYLPQDELKVIRIGKKFYYEHYNVVYKTIKVNGSVQYEVVGSVN